MSKERASDGPTFREWLLRKIAYWDREMNSPDRGSGQAVEFCRSEKERFERALARARAGFR